MRAVRALFPALFLPVAFSILFAAASAAADERVYEESLPIGLTAEEMQRLDEIGISHVVTSPPSGPIRNCAEWEPSEGVIIRYPLGISVSLVKELSEDLMVTTIVGSTSLMNTAISTYTNGGVHMENTQFIIAPTNSIWTRDYGPWFIFNGSGEMAIVDHIYNRPRPDDDQIPWEIGEEWNMAVYGMDLIHTGGNHMSDGLGTSMSTRLVYNENPQKTPAQIDSIMEVYLGNDYTVLDYIESGGIHHIDCWAKFLGPSTILVKDVSPSDSRYEDLNERAEFLSLQISPWGRPYTVIRVFCPSGAAYTNSIILNNKVFVPRYTTAYDTVAQRIYEEAMPGYEILLFSGSFYEDDAIHCRTMGVPDREMLYIEHVPLFTQTDTTGDYHVTARIVAHSGQGLIPDSLKIFYKNKTQDFDFTCLYPTANPDSFYGYIPAQPAGSEISYYLQAADSSGRVETHPYIGAPWTHKFLVEPGANMPPQITSPAVDTASPLGVEYRYVATATDLETEDTALVIGFSGYPSWSSITGDTLHGYAGCDDADTSFIVIASDGELTDTLNVTLIVDHSNMPPVIIPEYDTAVVQFAHEFIYYPSIIDLDDSIHAITYIEYPYWCSIVNDSVKGVAPGTIHFAPLTVAARDYCNADTLSFIVRSYLCGDADFDMKVNILDVGHIINFLYKSGPPPSPSEAADADGSGEINLLDVTGLVDYLYKDGPEPICQ